MQEAVADKGYCKLETLSDCAVRDLATSYSKPKTNGQRRWTTSPTHGSPPSKPTTTASRVTASNSRTNRSRRQHRFFNGLLGRNQHQPSKETTTSHLADVVFNWHFSVLELVWTPF